MSFSEVRVLGRRREHAFVVAAAIAMCVYVVSADAAAGERNADVPFLLGSREHVTYASGDVRAAEDIELHRGTTDAPVPRALSASTGALVIVPTFDSSITNDPKADAIESTINEAIAAYASLFNDPIAISVRFRFAATRPDGVSPLPSGAVSLSESVVYGIPWAAYIGSLIADATTANDATAKASLPADTLSAHIATSSADGRALALNTPPALLADGTLGSGGPYDGIITFNSGVPLQFTRPPASGTFDGLRATEHELDEVLGLGSSIGIGSDLRPQDLFSWSAAGVRNVTSNGSRFFSIDGGVTNIVGFNQNPGGDFGDWLSGACPQTNPFVQNAFGCTDQASDITPTSPEGINLDVVGYDLIVTPTTSICGDADANGMVTVTDGVQVLRAAAGLSSACTPARCDIDGSGEITVTDGVGTLRTAAGLPAPSACP